MCLSFGVFVNRLTRYAEEAHTIFLAGQFGAVSPTVPSQGTALLSRCFELTLLTHQFHRSPHGVAVASSYQLCCTGCFTSLTAGAEFIAKDLGMKVDGAVVEQLGLARKVTVAATATTLIADAASKDEIDMRIAQLKKELSETDSGAC